jgi:hypothetical protein
MNHLKSNDHKDEWKAANYDSMLKDVSTKSTLDRYRMEGASADARKYHGWMDWIVSKIFHLTVLMTFITENTRT